MVIVDAHCHASLDWYEPIETLLFEMDRYGVDQAVLIQINGQFDNSYQADAVRRYPGRFCSMVLVDPLQPDAPKTLERLAEGGASGVRLGPRARSPGEDPLALWRAAARHGLVISCGGSSADFAEPEFAEIVQALREASIVLEHLGGLSRPDDNERRPRVFELARFPNVFIKVTGLGEFATRAMPVRTPFPFEEPVPDYLERAYERFGPGRMMWGSDFPPVAAREGYGRARRLWPRATRLPGAVRRRASRRPGTDLRRDCPIGLPYPRLASSARRRLWRHGSSLGNCLALGRERARQRAWQCFLKARR